MPGVSPSDGREAASPGTHLVALLQTVDGALLLLVAGVDLVKVVAEAAFLVERALGGLFVVVD